MNLFSLNLFGRYKGKAVQNLIFFTLFYLYLWLIVRPSLIYYGGGQIRYFPLFLTGWPFFNETVLRPGGLTEYLSGFFSQFLIFSWSGSLVLTVHALLVCLFTRYILKKTAFRWYNIFSFIPAILLLLTYNSYTYHFTATLAFLEALVFSSVFIKFQTDKRIPEFLLFIFLFILLYVVATALSFYFALLCCIYTCLIQRRYLSGLFNFTIAVLTGVILTLWVFDLRLDDLYYSNLLTFSNSYNVYPELRLIWATYLIYLLPPMLVGIFGFWRVLLEKRFLALFNTIIKDKSKSHKFKKEHKKANPVQTKPRFSFGQTRFVTGFSLLLPVLVAVPSIFLLSDTSKKPYFELCCCVKDKNWSKIIEISYHYQDNIYFNQACNWALYHKGLLLSDMFSRQQVPYLSLMNLPKPSISTMMLQADFFYELGSINLSEMQLVELLELYGKRPEIIQKLAVIRLAKNDINTACVYLGLLSKTLFYRRWAADYFKKIEADPTLSSDTEIQRLRSLMPENNNALDNYLIENMFSDLLEKNGTNKMAFEYLMVNYLFHFDLDKIIENIPRLDDFKYPRIPRHLEEAILTYASIENKQPDLKGRSISVETQKRFSSFLQDVNSKVTIGQLRQNFGDTYQFFYGADRSGK